MMIDYKWIEEALKVIEKGIANKMVSPDERIIVYKVKNIVRIDVKDVFAKVAVEHV